MGVFDRLFGKRHASKPVQQTQVGSAATGGDVWLFDRASGVLASGDLVTLPAVVQRLAGLGAADRASAEVVTRLAAWDPALTARLLAAANDVRWGQSGLVDCISRATAILGDHAVREIPTGLQSAWTFTGIPAELATVDSFWSSSIHVAVAAREIAGIGKKGRPDVVFVAGLLHDIGQLVLLMRAPPGFRLALEQSSQPGSGRQLDHFEREHLSFDHARVGATLLASWRMPNCLKSCVAFHHQPSRARHFRSEVAIVHIANSLAVLAMRESEDWRDAPAVSIECWQRAGLNPGQGLAVVPAIRREALAARRLFAS